MDHFVSFLTLNAQLTHLPVDKVELMGSCKDDTVLSYLAVCIVPFEQLRQLVWRFYSKPPAFQFSLHGIRNIYSALLTQGWSLIEVLLTVYNGVLHLERQGVFVCVCMHLYFEIRFEGFRISRDRFMVKLKLGKG